MNRERDETTGRFTEQITTEDVLEVIRKADAPIVTVGEVADELRCSNEGARQKLVELLEEGLVERKKVGARAVVWWLNT